MTDDIEYTVTTPDESPRQDLTVRILSLSDDAVIPRRATPGSAAYDVFVPRDTRVHPGRQAIPLDLAIELPPGYEAKIEPRSGYSSQGFNGLIADTTYRLDADVLVGKIDSDYRGNIAVIVHSREPRQFTIRAHQRIAQLTIYRCHAATFNIVTSLTPSQRGHSGD
ncbi:MAG: hypothetical protein HDR82_09585 [Bacteroides sp.]|nr:hypothetical protein [Bacteroides sp.]